MSAVRSTLAAPVALSGIGLHSGVGATARLLPARPGTGIVFRRVDRADRAAIPAQWDRNGPLVLCTTLRADNGAEVSTIEHLMAAFAACAVDDAVVEVDGPEIPILDGSAMPFVRAIRSAGVTGSAAPRRHIRILRPVEVRDGDRLARLEPHNGFRLAFEIDFPHPAIGRSSVEMALDERIFSRFIAPARTFALASDVARMQAAGLARGGSLDNAVVVGEGGVLNPGGLRFPDEFVRHKILDAVGDLYLAGAPILGRYVGVRAGHALNNALLHAMMAAPGAWAWAPPLAAEMAA